MPHHNDAPSDAVVPYNIAGTADDKKTITLGVQNLFLCNYAYKFPFLLELNIYLINLLILAFWHRHMNRNKNKI